MLVMVVLPGCVKCLAAVAGLNEKQLSRGKMMVSLGQVKMCCAGSWHNVEVLLRISSSRPCRGVGVRSVCAWLLL